MKGLLLDTSASCALLALTQKETIASFCYLPGGKNLSQTLFPQLQTLGPLKDLDYIAVGIGPGSYMGLRTGATIAQTLSFALDLPLISFPSPMAFIPLSQRGSFAFIGDAKLDQLYVIEGLATATEILDLTPPALMSPEDASKVIDGKDFIIGNGFIPPAPTLERVAAYAYARYLKGDGTEGSVKLQYLRT